MVIQRQIYDSGFDNERSSDNLDVIAKYDMNNNIFLEANCVHVKMGLCTDREREPS